MRVAGGGWMRGLAADPYFAALEVFLLPDRHDLLQPVDREAAGFKGLGTMRRRDRDRDRSLADIDQADAMTDRDADDTPSLARLARQPAHLAERHRLVSFVLQPDNVAAGVVGARGPGEGDDRAGVRVGNGAFERRDVDRCGADSDRTHPFGIARRLGAAAYGRNECDLVAGARTIVVMHVFLVDREADRITMALERGELLGQALPHLGYGRTLGKFAAQLGGAGALTQGREQFYGHPIHLRFISGSSSSRPVLTSA